MAKTCRNCRFASPSAVPGNEGSGVCRIDPPGVRMFDDKTITSFFPPVALDSMRCGKFWRKPFWWRWIGRTG